MENYNSNGWRKTQPMISSIVVKEDVKLAVSAVTLRRRLCGAKLSARSPHKVTLLKRGHLLKRLQFGNEHSDWLKEKRSNIFWTDESKLVYVGSRGHRHTPKHWTQATVHCENSEAWWCKHPDMGMCLILWCQAYLFHSWDHGSFWILQNT